MPKPRTRLSQERIVVAALDLVDEGGLDELSMRKLAGKLGVEAMSLYNHVPSKGALVDALVDQVFADFDVPEEEGEDWRSWVLRFFVGLWTKGMEHPGLVPAIVGGQALGSELLGLMDGLFARFTRAGLSIPDQIELWELLKNQLFGSLSQVGASPAPTATLERYPHVVAVSSAAACLSPMQCFENAVRFILDGFPSGSTAAER